MISRIWHGYTTSENADAYQAVVTKQVILGILAMKIPGFRKIELFRRQRIDDVEFVTVMWFDDLDCVKNFTGEDFETSHVPDAARQVLSSFDEWARHYEVILDQSAASG